jgi:hypothetical protein
MGTEEQEDAVRTSARQPLGRTAAVALAAQLERRPGGWLRPFLQLAVDGSADPWHRLGPLVEGRATLVWHPRAAHAFERFRGGITLSIDGETGVLEIEGEIEGEIDGDGQDAASVLDRLATLLADASAAQTSG